MRESANSVHRHTQGDFGLTTHTDKLRVPPRGAPSAPERTNGRALRRAGKGRPDALARGGAAAAPP